MSLGAIISLFCNVDRVTIYVEKTEYDGEFKDIPFDLLNRRVETICAVDLNEFVIYLRKQEEDQ